MEGRMDGCTVKETESRVLQAVRLYRSMSWSTSSSDRARLGKLDSEPPLELWEEPPKRGTIKQPQGGARAQEGEGRRAGKRNRERKR